mgnify:FL=1
MIERIIYGGSLYYSLLLTCTLYYPDTSRASDYFDPAAIDNMGYKDKAIDLSALSHQGGQLPGKYYTNIYLNDVLVDTRNINFVSNNGTLSPRITKEDLVKWGVSPKSTKEFNRLPDGIISGSISSYLPGSYFRYDPSNQMLKINIPQIYTISRPQGMVPASEWNDGINAAVINYAYSGYNYLGNNSGEYRENQYLNLRSGLNIGGWRLRNYSTWSHTDNNNHWNSINSYLQHDVRSINSQVIFGESHTPSEVFDSFPFKGAQIFSDDDMIPQSMRGFAPIIRGIAQTNAQVTIRQSGNIIYQSYVPPGPFVIDDLYPTSAAGELNVSIREADGTTRTYTQAFSSVPMMQREGRIKYSVTAGKFRATSGSNEKQPEFTQATLIYGLPYSSTVYGGSIYSSKYQTASIGLGKGLGDIGSVSIDSTFARTKFNNTQKNGESFRFQYSKNFVTSGTSFSLSGYRYSTSGYYDFNESNGYYEDYPITSDSQDIDDLKNEYSSWRSVHNKKSKSEINISQTLGNIGSLYVSAYQQNYWGVSGSERSINVGYNVNYSSVNYYINYSESKSAYDNKRDDIISFSLQIPFDKFMPNSWINMSSSNTSHSGTNSNVGISGTAMEDNQLSYNLQQGYDSQGSSSSGSVSASYKAGFGNYQAGYNYTGGQKQLNYGVSGGVIIHKHGVTLSQPLGDTLALIQADNAPDIKVENNTGVYTNDQGYAVVPYMSPYQRNTIQLDTSSLPEDIDIINTSSTVIPTDGAVVLATFKTRIGRKILVTIDKDISVPFGSIASIKNQSDTISSGIVDDQQQVYLSGAPQEGTIDVAWKDGQCHAPYHIDDKSRRIYFIKVKCQQ